MSKMLFRRTSSDYATKELIYEWIIRSEVRYRVFARILEEIGLKGPFRFKYHGKPLSDTFICETEEKKKYRIILLFPDADGTTGICIRDGKTRNFILLKTVKFAKILHLFYNDNKNPRV